MDLNYFSRILSFFFLTLISYQTNAATLINGDAPTATLATTLDVDTWTFSAKAGQTIYVQIAEISGTNLEPLIRLYDPDGVLLTSNWGNVSADIKYLANKTGTYTVEVRDVTATPDGTGSYQLFLAIPGSSFQVPGSDEGGSLSNGHVVAGNVTLADLDIWTFSVGALETVFIQVAESADNTGGFQPEITIFDPFGKQVSTNWGNTAADLRLQSPMTGQYTVVVKEATADVPDTGSYNLFFTSAGQAYSVPTGDEGGILSNGGVHSGAITLGDVDAWTFTAEALDTVLIQAAEVTDDTGGFQPELRLFDSFGNELQTNLGNSATDLRVQLSEGGEYTVIVREATADVPDTGTYNLYFTNTSDSLSVPEDDEGGAIVNGGVYEGAIDLGDIDAWTFSGEKGDTSIIQIAEVTDDTGGFQPEITLYDPLGNSIGTNYGNTAAELAVSLPMAGNYTVVVKEATADVPDTGTYKLFFNDVNNPLIVPTDDQGGALSNGGSHTGEIELGDVDAWTFNGVINQTVRVQVVEVIDNTGGFQPELRLYDPAGNLVTSNYGNTSTDISAQLTITGQYTVVVKEASVDVPDTGTYNLYFQHLGESFSTATADEGGNIVSGGTVSGTIEVADLDAWTFSVDAGDQIDLTLTEVTDNGSFTPKITLYGPQGIALATHTGAIGGVISVSAMSSGLYTVVVSDGTTDVTNSGTYELTYNRTDVVSSVPIGSVISILENGQLVSGTFSDSTDIDKYQLNVSEGDSVFIRLGDINSNGYVNLQLQIFNSSGALLWSSTGANWTEALFKATSTEALTIAVSNSYTTTGSYDYQLTAVVESQTITTVSGDEGGLIASGQLIAGTIAGGDADVYNLAVVAGEAVYVRLGDIDSHGYVTPHLRVFSSNGDLLWSSSGANWTEAEFDAPASENLTLVVTNDYGYSNSYSYQLTAVVTSQIITTVSGDRGGVISSGELVSGTIAGGDADVFNLAVVAGESLYVRLGDINSHGYVTPRLRIFGSTGDTLWASSGANWTEAIIKAPNTETLTLVVSNDYGYSNPYQYQLTAMVASQGITTESGDEGALALSGQQLTGSFAGGDADVYKLAVVADETVYLRLGDIDSNGYVTPHLRVLGSTGNLLWTSQGANWTEAMFQAPATETLTLVLSNDYGYSNPYDYELTAVVASQNLQTDLGDDGGWLNSGSLSGGFISGGDADVFNLAVVAGEAVYVRLGDINSHGYVTPHLRIFDSSGNVLWTSSGANWTEALFYAPASENLTLVVSNDYGYSNSYGYEITGAVASQNVTTVSGDEGGTLYNTQLLSGDFSGGDADVYQMNVENGVPVSFNLTDGGNGYVYPTVHIFSSSGELLGFSTGSNNVVLELIPDTTEVITVVISNDYGYSNSYEYDVQGTGISPYNPNLVAPESEQVPLPLWALLMQFGLLICLAGWVRNKV